MILTILIMVRSVAYHFWLVFVMRLYEDTTCHMLPFHLDPLKGSISVLSVLIVTFGPQRSLHINCSDTSCYTASHLDKCLCELNF